MLKVFYYPTYFRIRQWGANGQPGICDLLCIFSDLVFSCLSMVLAPGFIPVYCSGMLFWFILAMLVVANTLYDARPGRKRTLGQELRVSWGDCLSGRSALRAPSPLWLCCGRYGAAILSGIGLLSFRWLEVTSENIAMLLLIFLMITVVFGLIILDWGASRKEQRTSAQSSPPSSDPPL